MRSVVLVVLTVVTGAVAAQPAIDSGRVRFALDSVAASLPWFQRAVREEPGSADAWSWLGEVHRRLENLDSADICARRALAIDPCNTYAFATLGDAYNPQYSSWRGVNGDSTRAFSLAAARCDPRNGNAWFSIWHNALVDGDTALEHRALTSLYRSGYILPSAYAIARWFLQFLPPDAVVLSSGDMDTYPLLALQAGTGFRTDVAVVNTSLLNESGYARRIAARLAILSDSELWRVDSLYPFYVRDSFVVTVSDQMIRMMRARASGLPARRPFCLLLTTDTRDVPLDPLEHVVWSGTYGIVVDSTPPSQEDTARMAQAIAALDEETMCGPIVSPDSRQSALLANQTSLLRSVIAVIAHYAYVLNSRGDIQDGTKILAALRLGRHMAKRGGVENDASVGFINQMLDEAAKQGFDVK